MHNGHVESFTYQTTHIKCRMNKTKTWDFFPLTFEFCCKFRIFSREKWNEFSSEFQKADQPYGGVFLGFYFSSSF